MSNNNKLFTIFCKEMDKVLEHDDRQYKDQSKMFNKMFKIERNIRTLLVSHPAGRDMYKLFMKHIKEDKPTILDARIYFRERQDTFTKKITKAFYSSAPSKLYRHRINFVFVRWVLANYKGGKKAELNKLFEELSEVRKTISEKNLPLAINRAKLFSFKVKGGSIDYMDLIQSASEGLLHAIDKFVPPYKYVFGTTAIGRMTGSMSNETTSTILKMSPTEKRILYRAKNAKVKEGLTDVNEVAEYVSQSFEGVTAEKIEELTVAAYGLKSLDVKNEMGITLGASIPSEENQHNDLELKAIIEKLVEFLPELSVLERKIISLKYGIT